MPSYGDPALSSDTISITEHFDVKQYIQNETAREGANIMWEKLVDEAKCQEHVAKEYARFRRENSGSGTPCYGDPALSSDTISRGTGNLSQDHGHCLEAKEGTARSGARDVEGATSAKVRRKLAQHGVRSVAFARDKTTTGQSPGGGGPKGPQQRQGKGMRQPPGKAKAKYNAHSVVLKTVPSGKGVLLEMDETATVQNSVTSEASVPVSKAAKWGNSVLSRIPTMCSLMAQSTTH